MKYFLPVGILLGRAGPHPGITSALGEDVVHDIIYTFVRPILEFARLQC